MYNELLEQAKMKESHVIMPEERPIRHTKSNIIYHTHVYMNLADKINNQQCISNFNSLAICGTVLKFNTNLKHALWIGHKCLKV